MKAKVHFEHIFLGLGHVMLDANLRRDDEEYMSLVHRVNLQAS